MPYRAEPSSSRKPQLAYSETQERTHDEGRRRDKARKIIAVLEHFLDCTDFTGFTAVDIGASTGYTVEALANRGATVIGIDIDEPGIMSARRNFGALATFVVADGSSIPMPDASMDIVVFNHIYEHVVDADAVVAEISRVLRPEGVAYFGLGNRWQVIEPHYRLPFLSWLRPTWANRYIARTGKAGTYYERFRSRRQLIMMCRALNIWDYTYTVLAESRRFHATDVVPHRLAGLPAAAFKSIAPVIPTYIWVATPGSRRPAGGAVRHAPALIAR